MREVSKNTDCHAEVRMEKNNRSFLEIVTAALSRANVFLSQAGQLSLESGSIDDCLTNDDYELDRIHAS